MSMLNAAHGARLKAEGLQMALDFAGPWKHAVLREFEAWLEIQKARGEREISIEMFRSQADSIPPTPKCWGNLPALARKSGLIAPLLDAAGHQVYRRAASPKTRAHPIAFYRVL